MPEPHGSYNEHMDKDDLLTRHLELCQRVFEDMMRDGSWPWRDSQKSEDLVDSKDNDDNV